MKFNSNKFISEDRKSFITKYFYTHLTTRAFNAEESMDIHNIADIHNTVEMEYNTKKNKKLCINMLLTNVQFTGVHISNYK